MIEISCNEIYTFYLNENQIAITNQIVKMTGAKKKIFDSILLNIFKMKESTGFPNQSITPLEFMKRFTQDKLVTFSFFIFF